MQRVLAILVLGFLALGVAGMSAGSATASLANCAPSAAAGVDDVFDLVAHTEGTSAVRHVRPAEGPQLACNSACARGCAARFGRCPTRECRQQFSACVRGCGC